MQDELPDCGYSKPIHRMELPDKDAFIKTVWLHYIFFIPHAELSQLQKGFRETLQMELLLMLHPETIIGFLVPSSDFEVSSEYFLGSFAINYSPQGSNS